MSSLLAAIIAFVLVAVFMPLAIRLAVRSGFVDAPGGRKVHDIPVPPIGGLVVFPVFILVFVLSGFGAHGHWPLIEGLVLLMAVGVADDFRPIQPWIKFGAQIVAACVVVIPGGAQVHTLGNLFGFGGIWLDLFTVPFSIIAMVLFINGMNLIDGLDGLAGGIGFLSFFWFLLACLIKPDAALLPGPAMAAAAMAGFLIYNLRTPWRRKASVFLGDCGSLCLGLLMGWYAIKIAEFPGPTMLPISVAWIIGLPVFDECAQFYRRVREGKHPFTADRGHLHHHFLDAGFTPGQASRFILSIVFLMSAIGYLGILCGVPQYVLAYVWIAMLFSHMALSYKPERYVRILKTLREGPFVSKRKSAE